MHYEVRSSTFETEQDAISFYNSLPTTFDDPTEQGELGARHYPVSFVAGGYWIVMFLLFFF